MQSFEIKTVELDGIPVFVIKGYFEEKAGEKLAQEADRYLQQGRIILIIDFGECLVINSLGVASMLDLTLRVVDDFKGRVFFSRLDQLKTSVLKMAGAIPLAEPCASNEDALRRARER
ncbi:MAG: hypothetical protein HQM09_00050 [Candidatus Riflebacteria bacterium]|nr:hypothetical protein [Candidatus Riflebacteria bacterium]